MCGPEFLAKIHHTDDQQQIFRHLDGTDLESSTRVVSEEYHHLRLIWADLANHGVRVLDHVHRSGTTHRVLRADLVNLISVILWQT
jgi:hypothetical protein